MKYIYLIIFYSFILSGCKTLKLQQTQIEKFSNIIDKYKKEIEHLQNNQKYLEKSILIYKDSLIQERGLKENSSSIGRDSSFLETTYATSLAKILEDGSLFHNIRNKDSIPTKIIYIKNESNIEKSDSTNINKNVSSDSLNIKVVYKDKEIIKEVIPFSYKIKYFCIGFVSCLIILFILWIILKIKGISITKILKL